MKKFYLLFVALFVMGNVIGQIVNIPDPIFKAKLVASSISNSVAGGGVNGYAVKVDVNNDGEIQESEALNVTSLNLSGDQTNSSAISDLTGINYFLNLKMLRCKYSNVNTLAISNLPNLENIQIGFGVLTSLSLQNLPSLTTLDCRLNNLTSLDVSNLPSLFSLNAGANPNLNSFLATNSNSLNDIILGYCNLTSLDVSNLLNLKELRCEHNNLTSLIVNNLSNLKTLLCFQNQLPSLNLEGLSSMESLICSSNLITNLDLSPVASTLQSLSCHSNLLTTIDVNSLSNLQVLDVSHNQLSELNLSGLTNITELECKNNMLTTLDVSDAVQLEYIACSNNTPLTSIFMKNGQPWSFGVQISGLPNLTYICVNENMIPFLEYQLLNLGITNCSYNSYCSFTPGGVFYTITGTTKYDSNSNGCDEIDMNFPNLKFNITNGTQTGSFITNASGAYSIPVQAGTHTVTPVIENPTYFNISLATTTVTFPATTSPFMQNFCITPNGIHQDLEVALSPISAAIPGFDSTYMLIYKNSGNQVENGVVTVSFNDEVLDFVSATPVLFTQVNNLLSWTFQDLLPLETRVIYFKLNVNSPMESPAVNSGDILNFTGGIVLTTADENSSNNISGLQQTVVNSFDPNDKTCLEGTSITPDMIGKYVHYMIRFENTGTSPAQNIVVKDMIDATKFDVSTLIPLNASHDYTTRITGNKVEFIFQNINLPFEDVANDGYIVFKIKTLPTLALGDSFSNSANIYFDYNFPIVTEPAVTTFAVLGTQDFVFNNYLTVYPNPTSAILNLTAKQAIELKSIAIYNVLGQLVLSVPNANGVSSIDVSNLTTGNYFLKVVSDKESSNVKFIKK